MNQVTALALRSMQHDMKRVERLGVNVANAMTPGYKRELVVDTPFANLIDHQIQTDAVAANMQTQIEIATDNRAGVLKETGEKLDLAIAGDGYFEILTPNGLAYTRKGNFQVDARGRLTTENGDAVMGKNGEIFLKSSQPQIERDGKIFEGQPNGVGTDNVVVAQIKLVLLSDKKNLVRDNHGQVTGDPELVLTEVKDPQIRQGHLENSNVSSMEEMVHLMQTMRHFESMQKLVQGYDEMLGSAIKKLGETS